MASYLLLESGSRILVEDGSGAILLEISVPAVTGGGDDTWYMYAAEAAKRKPPALRKRPKRDPVLVAMVLDRDDWTDDELAFLMALDVLA